MVVYSTNLYNCIAHEFRCANCTVIKKNERAWGKNNKIIKITTVKIYKSC